MKNTPYTIYGKLGVKSFTFLYDLSNESQNITKKDMPNNMTYLLVFNYLIVVFLKYLRNCDTQLLHIVKKEKVDIPIKVYPILLLDKVLHIFIFYVIYDSNKYIEIME